LKKKGEGDQGQHGTRSTVLVLENRPVSLDFILPPPRRKGKGRTKERVSRTKDCPKISAVTRRHGL